MRLSAQCQPAAAKYEWTGTDLPPNASAGSVTPRATTTYSVRGINSVGIGSPASATVRVSSAATESGYSPATKHTNDFCQSGNYPAQWEWNPALTMKQPAPAGHLRHAAHGADPRWQGHRHLRQARRQCVQQAQQQQRGRPVHRPVPALALHPAEERRRVRDTAAPAGQQTDTYLLDVPDGGTLIARNNVFVKNRSGNNSNGASITFGVESTNTPRDRQLVIEHNTFVAFSRYYDDQKHPLFPLYIASAAPGSRTVDANVFVGYCTTGNAGRDFRGTNASVLNFNEIDRSFRPRSPQLTGRSGIVGTPQYGHQVLRATRSSNALGARD